MSDKVNETIVNMITNLKPPINEGANSFNFSTPLKRSASSGSESSTSTSIITQASSEKTFDSTVTPRKRAKFDLSYIASPRETRRLRADLVEARNTITGLEARIEKLHTVRKTLEVVLQDEIHGLKQQHEYDSKTIEELEGQLQVVRKREAELKQNLVDLQSKYDKLKIKSDSKVEELDKSLSELKSDSMFNDSQQSGEISSLNRRILELEDALQAAEEEVSLNKLLAAEAEQRLAKKSAMLSDMQMKEVALVKARQQIRELEYERESYKECIEVAKNQAQKVARYPELERENEHLKEENFRLKDEIKNKLLMEEEINNLKTRLASSKELEKKLANLHMQQVQQEIYLEEWRSVARSLGEASGSDMSSPRILKATLEKLQQQEIVLTDEKIQLESRYNTVLHEAKSAKSELERSQKHLAEMKTSLELKQNIIHRMQKKITLLSRERDSYRSQLDSYEKDLTMSVNLNASGSLATNAVNQLQTQKERIESLEKVVDGYRDMVAKLESDLQASQPMAPDTAPVRAEQVIRLQKEVETLRSDNQRLRDRKDKLEIQIETYLAGHDSVLGGKVYRQKASPLAECITQRETYIEKLEEEVGKLKKKIKSLEEGQDTSRVDMSMSTKEVQTLREQYKSLETKMERVKEIMKTSMREFRDIVYMLLGYQVDRTSGSLYKLTSIYAEQMEDQLCFQLGSDDTLHLVENEFSSTVEELINLHLRHQKSLPVFLSAVTIELFQRQTISQ